MRFRPFVLSLTAISVVGAMQMTFAQSTVTDQYGTEFLTDVLPPAVQTQVRETQAVLDSGGGEGPIEVDDLGRFDLRQAGNKSSIYGPSEEELLVNQLLGVVLLPTPGEVRLDGWPGVEGIWHDFENFPPQVGRILQNYIGRPVSLSSLDRMVRDVIVAFREGDFPVVDVLLPEQDITSGVVQLVVIKSRLKRIRVEGADADTEEFIRSQMRVQEGEVIRASEVLQDLSWVNRSPYRNVDLVYAPGIEFGTTDVILRSYESRGDWFYLGYEDSGTEFLGRERFVAGFNFGDLLGPTQSLSYQFSGDFDSEHVRASSLVYTKGLPWRHWVTFFASFVEIDSDPIGLPGGAFLDSSGENLQLSARYGIPLKGTDNRQREMSFGFDYKSNGSNLEFVDPATIGLLTLFGTTVEIFQFSFGYNEKIQGKRGITELDFLGVYSPGGWSNHNSDSVFASSRALSTADYMYATGSIEHRQNLGKGWTARGRVQGQIADGNLQPSEQIGAGGYATVRGYDEAVVRGDHGFWATVELYAPELSLGRIFDWETETDRLQFLAFFDAAVLGNEDLLPFEPNSFEIGSVGVGMRWDYSDWFRLRVDYGHPVITNVSNAAIDESGRFHIGATATF
ncbi:MAG: ShlB/FhaC/HecB family hemolysin secretion/activation protein [Verrucomicrobiota bacterium]